MTAAHPVGADATTDVSTRVMRERQSGPDIVRAATRLPLNVNTLLSVLEHPCHVRQWAPDLEELVLLEHHDGHSLVYMRTRTPWPMRPRDAVTRFSRHQTEDGTVTLTMQGERDAVPAMPGVVRMPFIAGQWQLRPEAEAMTQVDYQQRVSPGGGVPQWLADQAAVRHVRTTLAALEEYVERHTEENDCSAAGPPVTDPRMGRDDTYLWIGPRPGNGE
ncbi:hypothetical protein K8B33_11740 [Alcanivorax sp. JB21]|uniref:START domain-containing protein n=1 Tax=Alcanivorax limicola TaxID=2874102 RepID=UPI001CBAC876|nr:START domain-containing protein [Alcanivorax limicola]MBZ2189773.1 hypothetical protein [Alcanivorax limicola]